MNDSIAGDKLPPPLGGRSIILALAGCAFLLVLALPLSNLFLPREKIADKSANSAFAEVSKTMQVSCADCHTPSMTSYPLYFQLPGARQLIEKDIDAARESFRLTKAQLAGTEPISTIDLAKIATVVSDGSMPPAKYLLMHWNASLSSRERENILAYIQDKQTDSGVALAPIPEQNPFLPESKKAALGEKLFNDKRLSADNTVSCASCHALNKGGTDGLTFSSGVKGRKSPVNTPTVLNCAYNFSQYWDGRAKNLAEQVSDSIESPTQMGGSFSQIVSRLSSDSVYQSLSASAYGSSLDAEKIIDALATYEKTLLTTGAPFDKYLMGDDQALDVQQKRGYQLFMERGCATCHAGVALGGMSFEKMGVSKDYFDYRAKTLHLPLHPADNGRFNVTEDALDRGRFKVPILRNVALTAPYFHDGSAKDLTAAVAVMAQFQTGKTLTSDENACIVAFLKSLTGRLKGRQIYK